MKTKTKAGLFIRRAISRHARAGRGVTHIAPDGYWLRLGRKVRETVDNSFDELLRPTFQVV